MTASRLARALAMPVTALALLVPAAVSQGAAETGTFAFENALSEPLDLTGTCLGAGAIGTLTGTEVLAGRFTENGPPSFGFHFHATSTLPFRIDFVDGRYAIGTSIEHSDFNALDTGHDDNGPGDTDVGQFKDSATSRDTATVYGPDGQALTSVTVHHDGHLIWRDQDADGVPEPGEIRSEVDHFRLSCR
jgi:hypothetical protein